MKNAIALIVGLLIGGTAAAGYDIYAPVPMSISGPATHPQQPATTSTASTQPRGNYNASTAK